jgi:hypothetical protein
MNFHFKSLLFKKKYCFFVCVYTLSPCKNDLVVKNVECEMRFSFPNCKRIADKAERLDEIWTDYYREERGASALLASSHLVGHVAGGWQFIQIKPT